MNNKYINKITIVAVSLFMMCFSISCEQDIELANNVDEEAYEVVNGVYGQLIDVSTNKNYKEIVLTSANHSEMMYFALSTVPMRGVEISVEYDAQYLETYNKANDTDYLLYPETSIKLTPASELIIASDELSSPNIKLEFLGFENPEEGKSYAIPYKVKVIGANLKEENTNMMYVIHELSESVDESGVYVDETFKGEGAVTNVLYFEVNDVNPLNALEFRLKESGKLFFDDVILFSSNVNYNPETGKVYIYNNPNVQYLLDNSETLLQPLRRKGIKVFLSLLGNHDSAGVAQLSDLGVDMLVKDIKALVDEYQLDGVAFDDEYSKYPDLSNPLFTNRGGAAASRLIYECNKAMPDKEMMVYYLGAIYPSTLITIDGELPGTYIDYAVADYGLTAAPVEGMDKDRCAGMSIELNLGRGDSSESTARSKKDQGYGYYMFFALNPSQYYKQISRCNSVCKGLYEEDLAEVTHYYKKDDVTRYER